MSSSLNPVGVTNLTTDNKIDWLISLTSAEKAVLFKGPNARFMTRGLFYEQTLPDTRGEHTIYTLKDDDYNGYISLYRLYMQEGDITEYEFANKYLASWQHWTELSKCVWFEPYATRWREELELSIKAKALREIQTKALGTDKDAFQASRYLLEKGWDSRNKKPTRSTVGRPTKESIEIRAKEMYNEAISFEDDYQRLAEERKIN